MREQWNSALVDVRFLVEACPGGWDDAHLGDLCDDGIGLRWSRKLSSSLCILRGEMASGIGVISASK